MDVNNHYYAYVMYTTIYEKHHSSYYIAINQLKLIAIHNSNIIASTDQNALLLLIRRNNYIIA